MLVYLRVRLEEYAGKSRESDVIREEKDVRVFIM